METDIRPISRRITFSFAALWVTMALVVLLFELDVLPLGLWAGNELLLYYMQTTGVLIALVLIPASLKLFHIWLKKLLFLPKEEAVKKYEYISLLRILALGIPAVFNLILYYLSLNTAPAFVALITMMATVFCLPGEKRMREELQLNKQETPLNEIKEQ